MKPWYETAFRSDYLDRYARRDQGEADADIDHVLRLIDPDPDQPLLDLACGAGRHLAALWTRGFRRLVGLDLSAELLDAARDRLAELGAQAVELLCADMRDIRTTHRFGTALSMFTSFGYFETDQENRRVLSGVGRVLVPGGVLLIDTLNRERTIARLVPSETQRENGVEMVIARSISRDGARVLKTATCCTPDGTRRTIRESVRMFTAEELREMLTGAGFATVRFFGSLAGAPYAPDAPRMIAVARKASP